MMPTLLVVDDEEPTRALLAAVFEETGYRVLHASNGRQALDLLAREPVQRVLSDGMMPVMDGYELCRRPQARSDATAPPIILMSATARWDPAQCGADAVLNKPFIVDEVEALVRRWLPPASTTR